MVDLRVRNVDRPPRLVDWIVDSDATHHMTSVKSLLQDYKLWSGHILAFGGTKLAIAGIGSARSRGGIVLNVYHVPEGDCNSLSTFSYIGDHGLVKFTPKKIVIRVDDGRTNRHSVTTEGDNTVSLAMRAERGDADSIPQTGEQGESSTTGTLRLNIVVTGK